MFYKSAANILEIPNDDKLGLEHIHVTSTWHFWSI